MVISLTKEALHFASMLLDRDLRKQDGQTINDRELVRLDLYQFLRAIYAEFKDAPTLTEEWRDILFSKKIQSYPY